MFELSNNCELFQQEICKVDEEIKFLEIISNQQATSSCLSRKHL